MAIPTSEILRDTRFLPHFDHFQWLHAHAEFLGHWFFTTLLPLPVHTDLVERSGSRFFWKIRNLTNQNKESPSITILIKTERFLGQRGGGPRTSLQRNSAVAEKSMKILRGTRFLPHFSYYQKRRASAKSLGTHLFYDTLTTPNGYTQQRNP